MELAVTLTGKRALVTGASRGLGAAIAKTLAAEGADVAITYEKSVESAAEVVSAIKAGGRRAVAIQADSADAAAVQASIEKTVAELGGLDILVNNAGIFPIFPVLALPDEEWDRVLRTNLYGAFYCAREAGRQMAGKGGVIINMASIQAFRAGAPGLAPYTSSKGALVSFTRALAVELGPMGIRVLAVAPTVVDTPGLQANMPIFEAAGVADVIETVSATLPLGRTAVPDDVARVVLFCASDLAALMTGDTLLVDAGHMTV